jgi:hypothetical protein
MQCPLQHESQCYGHEGENEFSHARFLGRDNRNDALWLRRSQRSRPDAWAGLKLA